MSTFFLGFVVIFQNFLSFLRSVLRVSPESFLPRRNRCGTAPVESAVATAILNHAP